MRASATPLLSHQLHPVQQPHHYYWWSQHAASYSQQTLPVIGAASLDVGDGAKEKVLSRPDNGLGQAAGDHTGLVGTSRAESLSQRGPASAGEPPGVFVMCLLVLGEAAAPPTRLLKETGKGG